MQAPTISAIMALLLAACDPLPGLQADPALASSRASTPPASPDCSSCHAYPLRDINHRFHLVLADAKRFRQGQPDFQYQTTCLDCHFNSIRHFSFSRSDTTLGIAKGTVFTPVPANGPADTTRGQALAVEIDSMIAAYARAGKMAQWRTGFRHFNGRVDVALSPGDLSDPESSVAYNPRDFSCSTVECHKQPQAVYRWMSKGKGFSACPSFDGNDPTCGEVPAPATATTGKP
jgi:hypothetical protein